MPFLPNFAHRIGLYLLAAGVLGVLIGLLFLAVAVALITEGNGRAIAGAFGFSAFFLITSGTLIWGGLKMRRSAIEQGSDLHTGQSKPVRTRHSGSPRPSFIVKPDEDSKPGI